MNCIPIYYYRILSDNSYVDKYGYSFLMVSLQTYMSLSQLQSVLGSLKIRIIVCIVTFV